MSHARAALSRAAEIVVNLCVQRGIPVTPANLRAIRASSKVAQTHLTRYDEDAAINKALDDRVLLIAKRWGYITSDANTWERVPYAKADVLDRAQHRDIMQANIDAATRHAKAWDQADKLLDNKAKKLGRAVTPDEFVSEIDAIYAKHGLASPF